MAHSKKTGGDVPPLAPDNVNRAPRFRGCVGRGVAAGAATQQAYRTRL